MLKSLKGRLVVLFTAFLLFPLLLFIIVFNVRVESLFEGYASAQQDQRIQQVVSQVTDLFQTERGVVSLTGLETIGNAALQNGMVLHVTALEYEIDWDISTHRSEECQLMLQHREKNMHSRYPNFEGGYEQRSVDLTYNGLVIGEIVIGYYGPYTFDDGELTLINSLNKIFVILAVTFLALAVIFGVALAVNLAKPMTTASTLAKRISHGDYGAKINERYSLKETQALINAINDMSETLQTKEQQKRRLTADVAHELRTPLSNLQGHIEAVIDGVWEPTLELMESCHEEICRLTQIVNLLLELDKYEDGRVELQCEQFKVTDFFESLESSFKLAAQEKGIKLKTELDHEDALCLADQSRLKQCMVNLISNALRYTSPGGSVTVSYQDQASAYIYSVSDTGIGIAPEDLSQIFERFYRADRSRTTHTGGVGIGLTITKAIVEMHGGIITVDSKRNQGTIFTISLPRNTIAPYD